MSLEHGLLTNLNGAFHGKQACVVCGKALLFQGIWSITAPNSKLIAMRILWPLYPDCFLLGSAHMQCYTSGQDLWLGPFKDPFMKNYRMENTYDVLWYHVLI